MATKYQVFVSSTFEDLKAERDVVIKAVLEMGHIPVGMEMFSAADDEQWRIIARHIEESDYYCVILAHRYGSTTEGISYTRKEYEYAVSLGIPVLGFVIDTGVSWRPEMVDKEKTSVDRLEDFRTLVKSKPVSFWKSAEDLYGKVSIALTKQVTANPRDGWVRASAVAGPEVTKELSRLSAENANLRRTIATLEESIESDRGTEVKNAFADLRKREITLSYKYAASDSTWSKSVNQNYAQCFYYLGPRLVSETELEAAAATLAMMIREDQDRPWWTAATNQVRSFFADLMALGLVEPSSKRHAVSDTGEYWSLTEFGHEVHVYGRRLLLNPQAPAAARTELETEPETESGSVSIDDQDTSTGS